MKPNFALNLSFEGIGLLHRSEGGWLLVGEVSLDADDLAAELSELRSKAKALAPRGLKTKLVIPNEQIRYIALEAPSDADDTEARVRGALDGATPYALDDLVYDWAATEGVVTVAAVARETLEEAETFAQEHRFNPFSFVALPAEDSFAGEPFFGLTAHAAGVLDNAEAFEPDEAPIRIMGAAHMPDPDTTVAETGPAAADTDA
ncbi:MAG: hypothetical protein RI571_15670, partial [Roseovarius sp.]|nr:hypothetical protein [Roseovarius sp.]